MIYTIIEKRQGIYLLMAGTTILAVVFAVSITYAIIQITGNGSFQLGAVIASTCSLLIAPPISFYYFWTLKQLHQNKNELASANRQLEQALDEVRVLSGLLPICSHCKKIRDSKGYWNQIESYISAHSEAQFSHSICPECAMTIYPEFDLY